MTFGPVAKRLPREIPLTLPAEIALLPEGAAIHHVQVVYLGPSDAAPRIVPVANIDVRSTPGRVSFLVPRLGSYQVVHRAGVPVQRERTFSFRGITGVSMGSGGAAHVGLHYPELFDFVAPLGGPVDWVHLLHYVRTYHLGGFCTEAERQEDPTGCRMASVDRTPPNPQLWEVRQDFEHWYYEDMYSGQGGTFDRRSYIQIFRDLALMFENPNSTRSLDEMEANITPPGVPDSERYRTDEERCASPVVIAPEPAEGDGDPSTGFFDDEYNPLGRYPVITFCDGGELPVTGGGRDVGVWDPSPDARHDRPIEMVLAVDIDGDGRRSPWRASDSAGV